jgi:hypothetical protein
MSSPADIGAARGCQLQLRPLAMLLTVDLANF